MYTPPPPTIPFTAEAYAEKQAEFNRLTKLRVEVMARLNTAREMGDLSENGAYKYAKFELGDIGRRLRALKHVLENGYVAKVDAQTSTAEFGKTITITDGTSPMIFFLVSEYESDLTQNKLSVNSPIGKVAVGKKVGERFSVETPRGTVEYTIIEIK
jgi:transcription elongation factor GreA